MDRKIHDILFQQMLEPVMPFFHACIAKARFDTDREPACFGSLNHFRRHLWTSNQTGTTAIPCNVWSWTSHIDVDSFIPHLRHSDTHFTETFWLVSPNMRHDRLFILCKSQSSF